MLLRSSLTTASVLLACAGSYAQSTSDDSVIQMPSNARQIAARAQGLFTLPPAPAVGSDTCTSPTLVVGNGPHTFDTTGATTTTEGQSTINCIFYNLIAIDSDVWFEWVAPSTGSFELTTCQLTANDTKIAVYAGSGTGTTCPVGGGNASGCSDDINGVNGPGHFQTRVTFPTTAGTHYLIQIGGYPGTAPFTTDPPAPQGPGQFRLDPVIFQPPYARDDGSVENAYRKIAPATDSMWMMAQGDLTTGTVNVTAVRTATGAVAFAGQTGVINGNPITLGVWEDPNDDGNPADAVLLSTFTSTVSLTDTDQLVQYLLPTPVAVTNVFFVGASYSHGSGTGFPAPADVKGCESRPGQAWFAGNAGAVDFTNLAANTFPPTDLGVNGALQGAVSFLTRADTGSAFTGTVFCIGDGVAPHTSCPCANNSATADGVGCLSSLNIGAKLRGTGTASISADSLVLQGSQMSNSSVLYFQGTTQQNGGNGGVFGDGLRCAGGVVVRLGTTTNVGGASTYPFGALPTITVRANIVSPVTRTYQAWYRNAATFCAAATFNLSNGLEIMWTP